MSNEVKITVVGDNAAKPAFDDAKKGVKGLGDEAKKTGEELKGMSGHTGKVAAEIERLTGEIKALNVEMDKTGDTALWADLDLKRSELAKFKRVAKELASDLAEGASEAGQEAGTAMSGGIIDSLKSGPWKGIAISSLVAIGVGASPLLGAVLAAGILGAAGTGGMVGGIVAAAHDPRVQQAGADFAAAVGAPLKDLGGPFVEPLVGALQHMQTKVRDILVNSDLAGGLKGMAGELAPLTRGLEGFVDKFIPGFVKGLKAAEPVLRTIANELPGLGEDISEMFESLAEDPDGAVMGMKFLIDVTGDALVMIGDVSAALSHTYEDFVRWGAGAADLIDTMFGWLPLQGDMVHANTQEWRDQVAALDEAKGPAAQFKSDLDGVADSAEDAADEMKQLADAIDDALGNVMNQAEGALRWKQVQADLVAELAKGERTLDENSQAGRDNVEMMHEAANVAIRIRDSNLQMGMSLDEVNRQFDEQLEWLRHTLYGFIKNKAAVDDFVNSLKSVPHDVTAEIRYPGLLEAISAAKELRALLGTSIRASVEVGDVYGAGGGSYVSGRKHGGISGAAGGGARGGMTWVGEEGPELVKLPFGSTVYPSGTSQAMASGQMGGGAGGTTYVVIDIQGTDDDQRRRIQQMVEVYGDGNVQVAFGKQLASV